LLRRQLKNLPRNPTSEEPLLRSMKEEKGEAQYAFPKDKLKKMKVQSQFKKKKVKK